MGAIRRGAMQLLAVTVVLLLALARIQSTQASKRTSEAVQVDLMHYLHEKSPYANPNLSMRERVRIAVGNSRARAEYFNGKITKSAEKSKYSSKAFSGSTFSNMGDYLMKVGIGSPAQTFIAIADTGSDLLWMQCNCQSCFSQPDAYFNPAASSSFSPESCTNKLCTELPSYSCTTNSQCAYAYSYGDQSTTVGILSSDILTLGSTSFKVEFGCGEKNQGTFVNTDGLVGLGKGPVSIIEQMGISVFSYCLVSFYSSTSKTSPLIFGNGGGSYSSTPLVSNSLNPTFYYVNLQGISVNGSPLSIPSGAFSIDTLGNGGFILDSGTTITQLQTAGYDPLLEAVQSLLDYPQVDGSSLGLDACYSPGVASPIWPSVSFHFAGVTVVLPGDNLFLLVDAGGVYCMAIQGSNFGFGIFGNVQQQNFNIQYDMSSNHVGFSPTSC